MDNSNNSTNNKESLFNSSKEKKSENLYNKSNFNLKTDLEVIDEYSSSNSTMVDNKHLVNKDKSKSDIYMKKYSIIDYKQYLPIQYSLDNEIPIYFNDSNTGPLFLCLHGAGHSGLSFAMIGKYLKQKCKLLSFDFRGHGDNKQSNKDDLSKETLINDTIKVIEFVNKKKEFNDDPIILLGHSMGGSIANFTLEAISNSKKYEELSSKIKGLIIIDVVEGTAMEALPYMENIVINRPKEYKTKEEFIEYMVKNNVIQNLESARISVPSLIHKNKENYTWKTDLLNSKTYWKGWFKGLTSSFLNVKLPKLLLLAGSERMDKELTIAHMQGKFQMQVIYNVGHIVHEDNPKNVASILETFLKSFKIPYKLSSSHSIF